MMFNGATFYSCVKGTDVLISRLSCVIGTIDTKVKFMKSLKKEALRFKRWRIADLLDKQVQLIGTV